MSRVILHETIHLWQYLSSGYLANLVEEDWLRLKAFEQGDTPAPAGPKRKAFLERSPHLGFSVKDLHEALARFWDMHILGPPLLIELELADPQRTLPEGFEQGYREAEEAGMIRHPVHGGYSDLSYRWAMRCAAGNYGKPYLWLLEQVGVPRADIIFPLAGFFAFQTPDPLRAFNWIARQASHEFDDVAPGLIIHDWWRKAYWRMGQIAVAVAKEIGAVGLNHIGHAVENGDLADHPIWYSHFQLRRIAGRRFADLPLFSDFPGALPEKLEQARGSLNLDYTLACPGDPDYKWMLVQCLAPAFVAFEDDAIWNLAAQAAREDNDRELYDVHRSLGLEIFKLWTRWERFLDARYGY
jgi:hypothetical protein